MMYKPLGTRFRAIRDFSIDGVLFIKGEEGILTREVQDINDISQTVTIYWDNWSILRRNMTRGHGSDNKRWNVPIKYLELVTETAQKLCTCNMNSLMIRGCYCGGI